MATDGIEPGDGSTTSEPISHESPFVTIWEAPRETVRRIVATDPRRHVYALFFAGGAVSALGGLTRAVAYLDIPPLAIPFACLLAGLANIPIGHLNAWYKRWVGGLLGGDADRAAVVAVGAWSSLPVSVGQGAIWVVQLALYGREVFSADQPTIDASSSLLRTTFTLATLLFASWSTVVSIVGFAEVNRFSIARSVATSLLALTIVATTAGVLAVALLVAVGLPG
jgi:hypothetical protein